MKEALLLVGFVICMTVFITTGEAWGQRQARRRRRARTVKFTAPVLSPREEAIVRELRIAQPVTATELSRRLEDRSPTSAFRRTLTRLEDRQVVVRDGDKQYRVVA